MQQADLADSIRSDPASAGKFDRFSTPNRHTEETVSERDRRSDRRARIAVSREAARTMSDAESELGISIDRSMTLLQVCQEITEEAEDDAGVFYRSPGYHQKRLNLVGRVQAMLSDELRRIELLYDASTGIVAERIGA